MTTTLGVFETVFFCFISGQRIDTRAWRYRWGSFPR